MDILRYENVILFLQIQILSNVNHKSESYHPQCGVSEAAAFRVFWQRD